MQKHVSAAGPLQRELKNASAQRRDQLLRLVMGSLSRAQRHPAASATGDARPEGLRHRAESGVAATAAMRTIKRGCSSRVEARRKTNEADASLAYLEASELVWLCVDLI